jgi:acetyltransferase-like isoleucine patch superfamily enzyme
MNFFFYSIKFLIAIINKLPLRFVELFGQIFPENSSGCRIRGLMYKPFLKQCGSNFQVGLSVKLEFCENITIGKDVYIGHGCWLSGLNGGLEFEDEVMLGPGVKMVSSNHSFSKGSSRFAPSDGN